MLAADLDLDLSDGGLIGAGCAFGPALGEPCGRMHLLLLLSKAEPRAAPGLAPSNTPSQTYRCLPESLCSSQLILEDEGLSRIAHTVQTLLDLPPSGPRRTSLPVQSPAQNPNNS